MGSKDDALDSDQFTQLLAAAEGPLERLVVLLAGDIGMREDEIAHLQKDWINFQSGLLTIPRSRPCSCADCKRTAGRWTPKSKAGARTIPVKAMSPRAWEALKAWFSAYQEVGLHRTTIYRIIIKVAQKSGLVVRIYPHCLRSTAAIEAAYKIGSPLTLCDLFGWTSITTALYYIRRAGKRSENEVLRSGLGEGRI